MTEQIDYDPNTVLEALNNKADRDLNNVTDGTYQVLTTKNITNCITKIPQDIKLELNDGTLMLKAGSKLYIPNGFESDGTTLKFDEIVLDKDYNRSTTTTATGYSLLYFNINNQDDNYKLSLVTVNGDATKHSYSGDTAPTEFVSGIAYWYDTQNNIVKNTLNSGSDWEEGFSLPLAIISYTPNTFTSIDQVFNGFGFIGSTIFALPGVEGLIPNGRNTDGSLNNTKFTTTEVKTYTSTSDENFEIKLYESGSIDWWYVSYIQDKNININTDTNEITSACVIGNVIINEGRITSFNPKTTFQAIDRNNKEEIISWGMPDLTAGVNLTSGTTIPVNSLVYVASTRSAGNLARAYLDGEEMFKNEGGASTSDGSGATFLAPENSIYTSSGNFDKQIYYPLKGEI